MSNPTMEDAIATTDQGMNEVYGPSLEQLGIVPGSETWNRVTGRTPSATVTVSAGDMLPWIAIGAAGIALLLVLSRR